MTDQSAVALINAVIYIVPLIALIVSIFTFVNASRERHAKSAAEQAEIGIKLDNNAETLGEIKTTVDDLRDGYHENHEAIEKLDTKIGTLENRVETVEKDIKRLEDKVHLFHTH